MKELLKEKKPQILRAIKEMEERKHPQTRFETVSFLIIESKTNFPICFFMESDESTIEVVDCPAEKADFLTKDNNAVIFYCGNSNSDWNALERKLAKRIIKTSALDFRDFAEISISVFGANKEESIFLSIFIASIIFSTTVEKIIESMDEKNIPPRIKDKTFYLYDYLENKNKETKNLFFEDLDLI